MNNAEGFDFLKGIMNCTVKHQQLIYAYKLNENETDWLTIPYELISVSNGKSLSFSV